MIRWLVANPLWLRGGGIASATQHTTYSFDKRTRSPLRRIFLPPGLLSGLDIIGSLLFDLDGVVAMSPAAPSSPLVCDEEAVAAADDEAAAAGGGAKFFLRGIWNSSMIVAVFANKGVVLYVGDIQFKCSVIGCGAVVSLGYYVYPE